MNPALKVSAAVAVLAAAFAAAQLLNGAGLDPEEEERWVLDPDELTQALASRVEAKIATARGLVRGQVGIREAVSRFRALDASWPVRENREARERFPEAGPDGWALYDIGQYLYVFRERLAPAVFDGWCRRWDREWPGCLSLLTCADGAGDGPAGSVAADPGP